VQFLDGTTDIGTPVTVSGGTATIPDSALTVGGHTLNADFTPGNNDYTGSTGSTPFTVNPIPTTTTFGISPSGSEPYGTQETLSASISPADATGSVQFEVGGNPFGSSVAVTGGGAQLVTTTLPVGTDSLSAVFSGTGNYGGSPSTSTNFTVTAAQTNTTLDVSPASPQVYGTQETLTATITPTADSPGSVVFSDNGTPISGSVTVSGGEATFQTSTLPAGVGESLTAAFTPTTIGFAPSVGTATPFTVTPAQTNTALTVSPASPQVLGTQETLTATVTPTAGATGTVVFSNNGIPISGSVTVSGGQAQFQTTALPLGTDALTAVFTPSAGSNYAGSNRSSNLIVLTATTTTLGVTPASPQYAGTTVTLTATVSASGATGSVQFEENGTSIGSPVVVTGGQAQLHTSTLPVGTDALSAVFTPTSGNGYAGSTGTASYTVEALHTTSVTLVSSADPSVLGASVSFTATVNDTASPTGTVHFTENGAAIAGCAAVALSGHTATCTTAFTTPGSFAVGAAYSGDAENASSSAPALTQLVGHTGLGYWLVASDGGVFNYGNAGFFGSTGGTHLNKPVVGVAPTPDGKGYWLVASDGGVFNYGDAGFFGSAGGVPLNKPIVGIAPTPDGGGYWLVASDGGVFNYGDAGFFGSAGGVPLNKPIVGIAPTADGKGYWLVASDGGVFNYGNAGFFGSTGGVPLNKPIVGIAPTPDGGGYWLVASDGEVFNYGDAGFFGSAGSVHLNKPIVAVIPSADGGGYWLVASDGGVFNYGDGGFFGSAGSLPLVQPIVGAAGS
jgi:hypothetical protein